jgi:hypothetical protein
LAELETGPERGSELGNSLTSTPPLHLVEEGEALISFQLGERFSLTWALAHGKIEVSRLPARAVIQQQVRDWLAAPAGPEKLCLARELHQVLFGHWTGPIQNAPLWLLVADGDLFEAPLAALVTGFKSLRPIYLAERHALPFVPGSWALERRRLTVRTGRFLGIADPIYNQADPRRSQRWPWADDGASQLTRLASSEAEVRACARYWTSQETLLGERAMPDVVSQQLGRSPAVIHLALHVVPAPDSARENMVALGAGLEGRPAYVGTEWIGRIRSRAALW